MSKFDYGRFSGDYSCIGFNARKYTKEKALEIGAEEYACSVDELIIEVAYIYYGFGVNSEGKKQQGYWIVRETKRYGIEAWSVYKK